MTQEEREREKTMGSKKNNFIYHRMHFSDVELTEKEELPAIE